MHDAMFEHTRPWWQPYPKVIVLLGVGGRTTCAVGLAEALRQSGVQVTVADTTEELTAKRWGELAGWEVPVIATEINQLDKVVLEVYRTGCGVVVVDTPPTHRDLGKLSGLLPVATDVLLTTTSAAIDIAKVSPLVPALFPESSKLAKARACTSGVLLNQVTQDACSTLDRLDPRGAFGIPIAAKIPRREACALAFAEHPAGMVDASFLKLASRQLASWCGFYDPRATERRVRSAGPASFVPDTGTAV